MQLVDIHAEFEKDCKIDRLDLESEAIRCPNLQAKWVRIWSEQRWILVKYLNEMKKLRLDKDIFYDHGPQKGEKDPDGEWVRPPGKILKQKIPLHLEADSEILELTAKIELARIKVDALQSYVTAMSFRKNNIDTILAIRRFEAGG